MEGVCHSKGGLSQQPIIVNPPGVFDNGKAVMAYQNGGEGVNENFTPARSLSELAVISNKFQSRLAGYSNEFLALFVSFGRSVLCITS